MPVNVGTIDRILRIVVGLVLIALVFVGPKTPWGWIGVIPLLTGLVRFCPAYTLLGLNTCAEKVSSTPRAQGPGRRRGPGRSRSGPWRG